MFGKPKTLGSKVFFIDSSDLGMAAGTLGEEMEPNPVDQ